MSSTTGLKTRPNQVFVMRLLAWLVALIALLNVVLFAWLVASPVIRSDAWYFLDVFLKKAIVGQLGLGDFFVRRSVDDHAQPLFKLALLLEWRFFDLDFMVESLIGVAAAAACAWVLHMLMLGASRHDGGAARRYLAWASTCAVLFSLNAEGGIWTWSLVSLEYVPILCILLYLLAVWRALEKQSLPLLILATLLLGISCDDVGLLAVFAAVAILLLIRFRIPDMRYVEKMIIAICISTLVVRVGYSYAPIHGAANAQPLISHLGALPAQLLDGGWWKWIMLPLVLPVVHPSLSASLPPFFWITLQIPLATLLLVAHVWFWRQAWRRGYSAPVFVAGGLMLLAYAELAGILVGRVSVHGNDYLYQPRYVVLYAGHLIALLLMWAGTHPAKSGTQPRRAWIAGIPMAGCVALLALQIPISIHAWNRRPYEYAYQAQLAYQIGALAEHPADISHCLPELQICNRPLEKRTELVKLLSDQRLNVFAPSVQQRHSYLPRLTPPADGATPPSEQKK
ncbi:hypothetical protein [Rhodanobacter sp. L36]|uniref:hypothetical protein n=1 Tax=Rhodanobacter sp. L36 TaxID=1747221 RepID=UPI00131DB55B|nr:hypothetical protein [Rhodanobacter sp. L36]